MAGKGHAGANAGEHGDLFVTVRVTPHPVFRRDGDDLHIVVPVSIHEAALGAKIRRALARRPGARACSAGNAVGSAVPVTRTRCAVGANGQRGDLVVEVRLVLPKVLDERSKELTEGVRADQ